MAKDINEAVREVCLWMPQTEEVSSHGSPNFRVRGKTFAMFTINHHGDGRISLWLNSPQGAQELYVREEPKHFFVPPYVGPKGWLGVHLDKGISWQRVAKLVREAYEKVAPPALIAELGKTPKIVPPTKTLAAAVLDPLSTPKAKRALQAMRKLCEPLPEVTEIKQFGWPAWRAGKKTFAGIYSYHGALTVSFWVGVDRQALLTADERFSIPAYMGHNGWIALDVTNHQDPKEWRELALWSYRHFANKRMLQALETSA